MPDFSQMKLGRRAIRHSSFRKLLAQPVFDALPQAPPTQDNTNGITQWGALANDYLNDCTCAGIGHSFQIATLNTGIEASVTDADVIGLYEAYCGYNPANPATDQGGIEDDVLLGIQQHGFMGAKLLGWVSINPLNTEHVRQAIAYFGSVYFGAEMPLSAQNQAVWDVVAGQQGVPGGWGGHAMVSAKYDAGGMEFITWGENQPASWQFWLFYADECHALLWDVWLKRFPLASQKTILNMLQGVSS